MKFHRCNAGKMIGLPTLSTADTMKKVLRESSIFFRWQFLLVFARPLSSFVQCTQSPITKRMISASSGNVILYPITGGRKANSLPPALQSTCFHLNRIGRWKECDFNKTVMQCSGVANNSRWHDYRANMRFCWSAFSPFARWMDGDAKSAGSLLACRT